LCRRFRRTRSGKSRTTDLVDTIVANRAARNEVHPEQDGRANDRNDQSYRYRYKRAARLRLVIRHDLNLHMTSTSTRLAYVKRPGVCIAVFEEAAR
jgi:hypothetical protein